MRYPFAVDLLWKIIETLVKDWQSDPFMFATEHDLQAELYKRIKTAFEQIGMDKVIGDDKRAEEHVERFREKQAWNRVTCEPRVRYSDDGSFCKPDIVVWDDLPENNEERQKCYESDEWPILFACELKLNFSKKMGDPINILEMKEWYPSKDSNKDGKKVWDAEKLKLLLKKNKNMYGCTLYLTNHSAKDRNIIWDKLDEGSEQNLWCYYACLPKL